MIYPTDAWQMSFEHFCEQTLAR